MRSKIRCAIVSSRKEPFTPLEDVLAALPIKTLHAQNIAKTEKLLRGPSPPHLVWTDAFLSDGNWLDVLNIAQQINEKVNVVVLSPHADMRLYLDVMNHGAFDFVTESFTVPELVHVLRAAITDTYRRRTDPVQVPSGKLAWNFPV